MKNYFAKFLSILLHLILSLAICLADSGTAFASTSSNFLNHRLEQLVKTSAPDARGLNYFILPDNTDLSSIPSDSNNVLTPQKVQLGKFLFHETALSINAANIKHWQHASCASCHFAQAGFRSNQLLALGTGGIGWNKERRLDPNISYASIDKQKILAPSILNTAFQHVMLWDGRAGSNGVNQHEPYIKNTYINRYGLDGLETQAIDGLSVHKMGTAAISEISEYQRLFAEAFPDRPYVKNELEDLKRTGLAIAAYERTVLANQAPFQKWLKGDKSAMNDSELRGAITFFSSTCIKCHTGPNLAKDDFYAVGFQDHPSEISGLNLGRSSVSRRDRDDFKFKVPQLYNLVDSFPYGHGGSFDSLRDVVEYFSNGKPQKLATRYSNRLSIWFQPLNFSQEEVDDLVIFLSTGLRDPELLRYVPSEIPSGLCFPNNDPESRKALKCD
jgi:cytochrome c peroxidase